MIYQLKNDELTVKVNSFGAEVISVIDNKTGNEFIWQGDDKYWNGHSPILFPFCGRLYKGQYSFEGQIFEMTPHGFAKRREFKEYKVENDKIELILENDEELIKVYPFKFTFIVGYKLSGNILEFSFKVINKDDKDIFFAVGGHPAFNCPIANVGNFNNYYIEFEHDSYLQRLFTESALTSDQTKDFNIPNNKLNLRHEMFDNDAIFLKTINKKDVLTLKSDLNDNYIKVTFNNMTSVGLWHKNRTDAPFICIEPWSGFPGHDFKIENICEMLDVNKISSGTEYKNSFTVEFHI